MLHYTFLYICLKFNFFDFLIKQNYTFFIYLFKVQIFWFLNKTKCAMILWWKEYAWAVEATKKSTKNKTYYTPLALSGSYSCHNKLEKQINNVRDIYTQDPPTCHDRTLHKKAHHNLSSQHVKVWHAAYRKAAKEYSRATNRPSAGVPNNN